MKYIKGWAQWSIMLIYRRIHSISQCRGGCQTSEGNIEVLHWQAIKANLIITFQGSVVFWHNLQSDGSREESGFHGACPTILGIKWVTNKWIREGSQLWTRPCQPRY